MEQEHLLFEGLILMVIGMSIVYCFLSLMIGAMSLSRFFERFSYLLPDPEPVATPLPSATHAEERARIALAIAIARLR